MGGRVKVAQDGVGLAVQTLTRDAALLGVLSDVAMRAEEDNRSAGEAVQGRYDAHGVRTCSNAVGGSSALLQRLTPLLSAPTPRFQDGFEKVPKRTPRGCAGARGRPARPGKRNWAAMK